MILPPARIRYLSEISETVRKYNAWVDTQADLANRLHALETAKNLIHASDAPETAAAEIALWFPEGGLVEYTRATDAWILSDEE